MTGFITLELYAATSAADTDFTAMLVDVDETGFARYLADGIVRARFRESTAKAEPIEPGRIYKYTIDLWATSNVFKAGHRIRVLRLEQQLPSLQPQPEHGREDGWRHDDGEGERRPSTTTPTTRRPSCCR